jgi:hypothetical protein
MVAFVRNETAAWAAKNVPRTADRVHLPAQVASNVSLSLSVISDSKESR